MLINLSHNDLKKICVFSTLLYNNHENFQSYVLKLLSDYFGFNYCAFVSSDHSLNLNNISSYNLNTEFIVEYKNSFREKDFFIPYLFNSNSNSLFPNYSINNIIPKSVISISDIIPYKEYERTDYYRFLNKEDLYYEIVLNFFYDDGKYSICIFKKKEDGDFTTKERLLLNYLYNIIHSNFTKFLLEKKLKTEKNILKNTIENLPFGLIIFDNNFKAINFNNLAVDYCSNITDEIQLDYIIDKFANMVFFNHSYKKTYNYNSTINKKIKNYSIDIIPKISFNFTEMIEKHYIIYIKEGNENNKKNSQNISELYYTYNLTKRELEISKLLCDGLNNDEISKELFISIYTVKTHIENIYKKIGVNSRTAAILKLTKVS